MLNLNVLCFVMVILIYMFTGSKMKYKVEGYLRQWSKPLKNYRSVGLLEKNPGPCVDVT